MIVICANNKCKHHRDEICKIDESNCRIFMWNEIENCPESIVENEKTRPEVKE